VIKDVLKKGLAKTRRAIVAVVGTSILLVGMAMIILPGPAILVIPLGIAVLGIEFAWARRFLRSVRERSGTTTLEEIPGHHYRPGVGGRILQWRSWHEGHPG
jgi:tellurite resistance protein TerC